MKSRVWMIVAVLVALGAAPMVARAQKPTLPPAATEQKATDKKADKTPELSDVEKLSIVNLLQRIELAQLKAQAAQTDFDQAREQVAKLVQSLQKDGYDLNLQTMTYAPKPKTDPAIKKDGGQ